MQSEPQESKEAVEVSVRAALDERRALWPAPLQKQIDALYSQLAKHAAVEQFLRNMTSYRRGRHIEAYPLERLSRAQLRRLVCFSIGRALTCLQVTKDRHWAREVFCYADGLENVQLGKEIARSDHVALFHGRFERSGRRCVVKMYYNRRPSRLRTTAFENEVYDKLGGPAPCISTAYHCWGTPVLVLEPLRDLRYGHEDIYKIGTDVLQQLFKLHTFTVHSDLKPRNIMRRGRDYVLIDFGGCAVERYKHGWRRRTWTRDYASQKRGHSIVIGPKQDFLELAWTLNALQYRKDRDRLPWLRTHFQGRLRRFVQYVQALPDDAAQVTEHHQRALLRILQRGRE